LGRRAEEVYGGLAADSKDSARQLFMRLVTLGEGAEDTRRRVLRTELEGLISDQGIGDDEQGNRISDPYSAINYVVEVFGKARLLTFDRDPVTRAPTVEVAHEALLQEWRRLREWLDESRADIRMQRVLGNAAAEWLDSGQEVSFLMRGSRLDQFEGWVAGTDLALTGDEQTFMDASLEERREREDAEVERQAREARMERRSRNFLRGLVVVLAVAAIVAVILSAYAFTQRDAAQNSAATATVAQGQAQNEAATAQAEAFARATQQALAEQEAQARATAEAETAEERDRAVVAEQDALVQASIGLAGQALNELNGDVPERAVPLALEALEEYPYTWQAERALGEALLNHRLEMVLSHDDVINTLEVSQDGARLLSGSLDGTARVWDTVSGEEVLRITTGGDVYASWSPDEETVMVVNEDGEQIKIFETGTGAEVVELVVEDTESSIGINPNGWDPWSPSGDRVMVTFDNDGTVRIWQAQTGELLNTLSGHEGFVCSAMWSPAGDLIATGGCDDGMVVVWQAESGEALYSFPGGYEFANVKVADWSPDGERFATRGGGGAKVYEAASGRQVLELSIPDSAVFKAIWSPDGSRLLTSGDEGGSARIWDAETGELLSVLTSLTSGLGASWSPSGEYAAVVGEGGNVHIWDTVTGFGSQKIPVWIPLDAVWSPEEDRVYAYGQETFDVSVFKLSSALASVPGMQGITSGSSWSPDGRQFSRGNHDGTVVVRDVETLEQIFILEGGTDWPGPQRWSPDGDRILTANVDGTVRVWDAASGELLLDFTAHESMVFTGEWSPDGSRIVTTEPNAGQSNEWESGTGEELGETLILWDSWTGEEIWSLSMPMAAFASWSPEGDRIAVTTWMGNASILDAATGEVLLDLSPDSPAWVEAVVWSSDGEKIVTFSEGDGWIFDPSTGERIVELSSTFTSSVWNVQWSPGDERIFAVGGDGTYRVFDAATGAELLVYAFEGWPDGALSPDGSIMVISTNDGKTSLYPAWQTKEELIDYAKECCLVHELTPEEREVFGLPER
jgi:WD40 repeat protein